MIFQDNEPKETVYTIIERLGNNSVRIRDYFKRSKIISAGADFKVGDQVKVVSGVLISTTKKTSIKIMSM